MERMFNSAKIISSMLIRKFTNQQQVDREDCKEDIGVSSYLLDKIMDEEHIRNDCREMKRFGKEEGWRKICEKCGMREEQKKILKIGGYWKYVAAVVVLGVGIWMLSTDRMEPETEFAKLEVIDQPVVARNTMSVQLKLQNGTVVDLGKNNEVLAIDGGIVARDSGTLLSYEAKEGGNEAVYNEIYVPRGAGYRLKLSDGTIIHLNSMSRMRYPVKFIGKEREIELEGEAFLEVTKDPEHPFVVKTQSVDVKVLGTKFNISSYENDLMVRTTLVEGAVRVSSENGMQVVLKPDEQMVFHKKDKTAVVIPVDVKYYTAWIDGWFRFRDIRLEELMKVVMRWYDVEVVYADPEIKDYLFGCNFNRDYSIESLIRVFEQNGKVKIEQKDKVLILMKGRA